VANPCRLWDHAVIVDVLIACVILHKMVIDDEEGGVLESTIELQHNI